MRFLGYTVARTKKIEQPLQPLSGRGGWWRIVNEPSLGAWQRNESISTDTVLSNPTAYACIRLIASDIAKCGIGLVELDVNGIWKPTESASFSPLLRRPNRFQDIVNFVEQWIVSKLTTGNTYVLLERDLRGVVVAMYILDPSKVTPLVAPDGSVYYRLTRDDLSGLNKEIDTVPASEIIHDRMPALYHPLMGVSPIYAAGAAATQGLTIGANSNRYFTNGSQPGGILTAPQGISKAQADAIKEAWQTEFAGDNAGKVAVLGGDLKYTAMAMSAVDSQLIEQLRWSDERICSAFGVPPSLVGVGQEPPYAGAAPLIQRYYNQCLQTLVVKLEKGCEYGMGLEDRIAGRRLGVEVDTSDLIWMDALMRAEVSAKAIGSGAMSPNESRKIHFGLGPVDGGDTPYLQVQNYSLSALNKRDSGDPFAPVSPEPAASPVAPAKSFGVSLAAMVRKQQEARVAA